LEDKIAAYCAGLFDGEGCATIRKHVSKRARRTYVFNCAVSMTDIAPLLFLHNHFGGSVSKRTRLGTQYVQYAWFTSARKALYFAETILPFSMVKKSQLEVGITFQKSLICKGYGPVTDQELEHREGLYWHMRHLKTIKEEWEGVTSADM